MFFLIPKIIPKSNINQSKDKNVSAKKRIRLAVQLVQRWQFDATARIKETPYEILFCEGVDAIFSIVDAIAQRLNIPLDSPMRIDAALEWTARKSVPHTAVGIQSLHTNGAKYICSPLSKVSFTESLDRLVRKKRLVLVKTNIEANRGFTWAQLPHLAAAEESIARDLRRLQTSESFIEFLPGQRLIQLIEHGIETYGISLSPDQQKAVETSFLHKVSIITGAAGSGKTAILGVLAAICEQNGWTASFAAPTGMAAKRLGSRISKTFVSQTIHRLLQIDWRTKNSKVLSLESKMVVVDEVSMMDTLVASVLLRALDSECHLVIVGDSNQLPSIGPGNVLHDLIWSRKIPVTRLETTYRQEQQSDILKLSHAILKGKASLPPVSVSLQDIEKQWDDKDVLFWKLSSPACPEEVATTLKQLYKFLVSSCGFNPHGELQFLSPRNNKCDGVHNLNEVLQGISSSSGAVEEVRGFRKNDKVMYIENDYGVGLYNGTLGKVQNVDVEADAIVVSFDDGAIVLGSLTTETQELLDDTDEKEKDVDQGEHTSAVALKDPVVLTSVKTETEKMRNDTHKVEGGNEPREAFDIVKLQLAHALTVHKSQGSQFKAVVLLLPESQNSAFFNRQLLYTAVTRPTEKLILVGTVRAFESAARNKPSARHTLLLHHIDRVWNGSMIVSDELH